MGRQSRSAVGGVGVRASEDSPGDGERFRANVAEVQSLGRAGGADDLVSKVKRLRRKHSSGGQCDAGEVYLLDGADPAAVSYVERVEAFGRFVGREKHV